jgi:hypothetical protein
MFDEKTVIEPTDSPPSEWVGKTSTHEGWVRVRVRVGLMLGLGACEESAPISVARRLSRRGRETLTLTPILTLTQR